MTSLLKPTIKINRLLVSKNGEWVVDLNFHEGLNVIRGENAAGKTTLLRFITYALGAENINFNQAALQCNETFIEVAANGTLITLRRTVSASTQQPLMIYWGSIIEALSADSVISWQSFPFRRSESKDSFSQVLFRLLEMPELRGDSGSNITMHQLIRLIYSDQETPSGEIFRSERFDPAITRAAVGDYLLGIDSNELYELKLREIALEKSLTEVNSGIRTIYNAFGSAGTDISLDFLNARLMTLASEFKQLEKNLASFTNDNEKNPTASNEDDRLRQALSKSHQILSQLKNKSVELESEIADSALFLTELNERIASIDESITAESSLGKVTFSFCPSCFAKLSNSDIGDDTCSLCKEAVSKDSAKSQLARMRNELALQIKESTEIRKSQIDELESVVRQIPNLQREVNSLERDFQQNNAGWRPAHQIAIQNTAREIGAKEQEIKNTTELLKLAELLNTRQSNAAKIGADLETIRGRIKAVTNEQEKRRQKAYNAVAEALQALLRSDLERESEFVNANEINIDFGANKLSIDGTSHFSASSMIYLRHSFHLALLFASINMPSFRYPRFVIIDGIEDGGMELERSYNFQKLIKEKSKSVNVAHQIIIATSQICPELDNQEYVVGSALTHEKKSILNHSSA